MSCITIGYKRSDGTGVMLKGPEVSESNQRAYIRTLGAGDDTYEKVEIWHRGIPIKAKRMKYDNKPTLTITAANKSITYGDAIPTYTANYSGWTDGDSKTRNDLTGTLALACEYVVGSNVGTYAITPSGITSTKYTVVNTNGTVTVTKKSLTVTVQDATMVVGGTAPTYSVVYSGFVGAETSTVLTGSLSYTIKDRDDQTVDNLATAPAGEYSIIATGLTSDNYQISFVAGTLTITAS